MSHKKVNVAIVGATGAVGTEMLRVLSSRKFPVKGLSLLASKRSDGKRVRVGETTHVVRKLEPASFNGIDIALFSAGASRSLEFAPEAVKRGAIVVDNSSAFRMKKGVPLVVPEVNPNAISKHKGIIANPNCSTIIMVVVLGPLNDYSRLKRVKVATYQAVSGAGTQAMGELYNQTKKALAQCSFSKGSVKFRPKLAGVGRGGSIPAQIAFNMVPQVDVFTTGGDTKEELKMVNETRKILNIPGLPVSTTCVRVPVFTGHSEAVWVETARSIPVSRARVLLKRAPGVRLIDNTLKGRYPLPIDVANKDDVFVGRIRKDTSVNSGLVLWISGDNLRKGAATNAVQIAEHLLRH